MAVERVKNIRYYRVEKYKGVSKTVQIHHVQFDCWRWRWQIRYIFFAVNFLAKVSFSYEIMLNVNISIDLETTGSL